MSRPIEFRLWAKGFTKMMYEVEKSFRLGEIHLLFVEPILMQFIGLLDCNGKKIFEGDILKFEEQSLEEPDISICELKWHKTKAAWILEDERKRSINFEDIDLDEWEIIGNIYENSEIFLTR